MTVHYALSYQYFQFMYITCIYLSYHCLGWYTVRIWVFICVCCAAPDKLTSPPPFTGLGALQHESCKGHRRREETLVGLTSYLVGGLRCQPLLLSRPVVQDV